MYKRDKQAIYNGMIYMTVTLAGMSFMLLGIGFVHRTFGTLDLDQIAVLPQPSQTAARSSFCTRSSLPPSASSRRSSFCSAGFRPHTARRAHRRWSGRSSPGFR